MNDMEKDANRKWDWQDKLVIWGCFVACVVFSLLLIEGSIK